MWQKHTSTGFSMELDTQRPIRVVLFGGGPELTRDIKEFIFRLVHHPEIELVGVFCQAESLTIKAIWMDLWKRRGFLAFPLFLARLLSTLMANLKDPVKERMLNQNLREISNRFHWVADIHSAEVIDTVRSLAPDLGLIYGSPILKPSLFEIPKNGTLGIHHGKLPAYRGNKTTFWAMYNGEPAAGVTIQKVNAGLDTGSIVKEGEVPISRRSYATVWTELEQLGLDLYIEAILEVKYGTASLRPQTGKKGKLYKNPKPKDFLLFWSLRIRRGFKKYSRGHS
jgi:folate-dependent phosphoribosylglycinamide formyltransferase PurN